MSRPRPPLSVYLDLALSLLLIFKFQSYRITPAPNELQSFSFEWDITLGSLTYLEQRRETRLVSRVRSSLHLSRLTTFLSRCFHQACPKALPLVNITPINN
ncbi:hypothetical protein FVER53590_30324 [Fusarium verticillioides]|nr:hypothetical protein FVER53590_30324 [Fusarium verticillioides]